MANDLTQYPWLVDTVQTPLKSGKTWIHGFVYYGVNSGDTATFQDSRGRQMSKLTCQTPGQPVGEAWFTYQPINGLALTQISSGYCEVIVK